MSRDAKLTALLEAYRQAEPNRYRGGILALTGFQYQVWSYLADFAQALVSNNLLAGGQVFTEAFEALSDYTRTDEMGTVCVQVKHRLDRRRMSDAAAEFASINRFLNSHNRGGLQHGIAYEVVARNGDASLSWDDVQLPAEVRARDPDLLNHFEEVRRTGRLRPPRFEPDPSWKFIATVFGYVTDPFGFARRSLERCLLRSTAAESAAYIRNAIAEDYSANVLRAQIFSQSLRPSDFELDMNGRGTSIARTPTLFDLRSGRFMSRQHRISEVLATLDDLLESNTRTDEPVVPMLWIDGRSGSGKSVLLLQLLRHLVIDRNASVVWLMRTEELGRMVDQLVAVDDSLQPDFVFVDDIYDPHARDDLDAPRITRQILHSGRIKWPLVITCGPTEFRQDFERDCRAEGFRLAPWHLSALVPAETAALRTWFESRTGKAPELGPAQSEERALMISVMFELAHGDLRPFALRFRARIVADQLESALAIPLALNRLYIWTPRNWLSMDDEAKIERINQDGDFSFLSLDGLERGFLKLTHPHLSDGIYRALYPEAAPLTFARHLTSAFTNALASHLPTAIRLLRAIASNAPRLEIVDQDELARGITFAWNAYDESRCPRVLAAEAWVSWTRWAARRPSIVPLLRTTPLDKAVLVLGTNHPRWPSLWSQLSQSAPGDPRLDDLAQGWLAAHPNDEGWSFVWCRVTGRVVQLAVVTNETKEAANAFSQMGLQWLQTSYYQVGWSRVWEQLIETPTVFQPLINMDALVALGADWCTFNAEARDWNFVWEKLAAIARTDTPNVGRKQAYVLGLTWLKAHYNHPGWSFVWQHFMRVKVLPIEVTRETLVDMAHSWRIDRETDPAWPYVAQMLTKTELRGAQVSFDAAVTWIEQNRSRPQWPSSWVYWFEIRKHFLTHDQRRRLFMSGCAWLADDDERDQAISVVRYLVVNLNTFGHDPHNRWLVNKARQVLSRSVDNDDPEWFDAWSVLFRHVKTLSTVEGGDTSRTLTDLGQHWLAAPSHLGLAGWYEMFNNLYGLGLCRDAWAHNMAITAICRGFISDVRGAKLVSRLLSDDVKSTEPSENLLDWLDQWFTTRANGSGGVFVWFTLDRAARAALERAPSPYWAKLKQILDFHRLGQISRWASIVEHYIEHRPISGRVIKTVLKKKNKNQPKQLGYVVDIGVNAYLSVEEANIDPGSEAERLSLVGQVAEFEIVRLDQERFQVDVSRRAFLARRREDTAVS